MKVSAIGFDWGGVIFQTPGGSFNDAAAAYLKVDNQEFRCAYFLHNHMVNKGPDAKDFSLATEMWSEILTELGKSEMLEDFMGFVRNRPKGSVNEEVIGLLKNLRAAGWKLGLFSNNSFQTAQEFRHKGYDTLFDVALFSAEVNCMKPEPAAFILLAERLNVSLDELIFIDDSERSLSTATEFGYTPVLFKDVQTLIRDLHSFGILI